MIHFFGHDRTFPATGPTIRRACSLSPTSTLAPLPRTGRQRRAPRSPTFGRRRPKIAARIVLRGIRTAVMHAQILERARTLTPRYVANASHSWASADQASGWVEPADRLEC